MNTRALYWAAKAIVSMISTVGLALAIMLPYRGDDWFAALLTLGLGILAWCMMCSSYDALDKLKAEANRDTRMGLNGPARPEDLL